MAGFDRESRELILNSLRDYAERNLSFGYLLQLDKGSEVPKEKIAEMNDPSVLGIHLVLIPEEYGGMGGSTYDVCRVCELLARIDLGVATTIFATILAMDPIRVGGTTEQKEKWINRVAEDGLVMAYCATEADAGSDLAALKTRAVPVVEEGKTVGYRLTGAKQWISNGAIADLYTVLAKCPGGASWFIVEQGTAGLDFGKPEDKHGIRAANTSSVFFSDVFVPAENLLGMEEGQGLHQAQAVFGYTRLIVATFGLGAGWEALDRSIRYSQERIQAGAPLAEKQGFTHKLIVPHAVRLEAVRAYIEAITQRIDQGDEGLQTEGAIAKYWGTESGNNAAEASIQAHGGYGYTREYAVEKIKRDVRVTMIYEGTNEIMEMTIARNRWQAHLKSGGTYYRERSQKMAQLHQVEPNVGAYPMVLGLEALNMIFDHCRRNKLTRNQHVLFKLGELVAEAEVAMTFSESAAAPEYGEAVIFDRETWQAMARIRARQAAMKIAQEGIQLIIGAVASDTPALINEMQLPGIAEWQLGQMADMDLVAGKLKSVFSVENK